MEPLNIHFPLRRGRHSALCAFAVIGCTAVLLTAVTCSAAEKPVYKHPVLIEVEGEIGPRLEHYLFRKLDAAKEAGADLIVLEIDSPGGRVFETLKIAWRLSELNWAHTVAYVPREAISGAAIMSLGCDEILMAPLARFGDAGPISIGEDSLFRLAPQKMVSYLTDELRALAKAKNRPPALAEAMADKSLKVFHVRNKKTQDETYISDREFAANPGDWEKLGEVAASGNDRFLALTGNEALECHMADALIRSREELAKRYDVKEFQILSSTWVDTTVAILNSWLVTGLLLIIGLTGLYFECISPGHGVGGLVGVTCFLLLFWSHFLGGTAGWLSVLLFVIGVGCVAVEILLLPGTVVPGLVGSSMILVSLVMVCQGFVIPKTESDVHTLAKTMTMIVVSGSVFVGVAVVITRRMDTLPFLNRLMLVPPEDASIDETAASSGERGPAVGDLGTAHTALRRGGKGRFGERVIDVMATGDFLERGTAIRVVRVSGNQVFVDSVDES